MLINLAINHRLTYCKVLVSAFLIFWISLFLLQSIHWQMVGDPAQLQYATFMMDHGLIPYRDLMELNMPGVYLTNWAMMHWLGGALTWRIFDLALMILAAASMIFIAWPYDWFAGVLSAALFILFHGRDGAMQLGQRDLVMAVMLLCAYAFLFCATRRGTALPMLGFGVAVGIAATMKPTPLPFILFLLILIGCYLQKKGHAWLRFVATALAGLMIPLAMTAIFLLEKHAFRAFMDVVRVTYPYYATLGRRGYGVLSQDLSASLWGVALLACMVAFWRSDRRRWELDPRSLGVLVGVPRGEHECNTWEMTMIGLGVAFGIASYFGQGKGIIYHHYPLAAFLFLFAALQFTMALHRRGFARILGILGITYSLVLVPCYALEAHRSRWDMTYINSLTGDLNQLGGNALNGKVQCIAADEGDCVTVLYRLRLVQSTGLFYDYLIFGPANQPAVQLWRTRFWQQLQQNPPEVMIVHIGSYPRREEVTPGYEKLSEWPDFEQYLGNNFILFTERRFPPTHGEEMGYRIYVRRDMTLSSR